MRGVPWEGSNYTVLLQIASDGAAEQSVIDAVMQDLLGRLQAANIVETEPYD